jgi:hypothetical protein
VLNLIHLAEGYRLAGQVTQAQAVAEQMLACCESSGDRGSAAWILRCLGDLGLHAESPRAEDVEGYYRRALAVAEALHMRPLQAHCHLGLGTLYQKTGRLERVHAELAAAAELYRAMEMTFWLEKAEAAQAQAAH